MECVNCGMPALWVYENPASDTQSFCDQHLPRFLRTQAIGGLLKTTAHYAEVHAEVIALLAPEPEVEEIAVEIAVEVAEEPAEEAPKKRARKAAATEDSAESTEV